MDESEQRQIARESLFVMADLRLDEGVEHHRIKVRNLSAGGMMGEGSVRVFRGAQVWVNIRNLGWVEGTVAWVQENRFGLAFRDEIDPKIARTIIPDDGERTPRYVRPVMPGGSMGGVLRKV